MVLGTLFSSGAATGTGAPTTGMGVAVDAEGTGAAVDVCAAAEAGMEEVAEWDVGLAIAAAVEPTGGGWPWEHSAVCPDAS